MSVAAPRGLRYAPFLLIGSVGYVTFGYSAVPSTVVVRFGTNLVSVGLLMSSVLLAFGLVQIPSGWVLNATRTTPLLLVGALLHALFAVALDLAPTFRSLLVFRFLWGLAGGFLVAAGATHVARLYSGTVATRMQGIYGGVLTLGGAFGFLVVPAITTRSGWLGTHAIGALLALPAIVALAMYVRRDYERLRPPETRTQRTRLRVLFADPTIGLAALCYVAVLSSYITLSTFVTAYFEDVGVLVSLNALILVLAGVARAAGGIGTEWWMIDDTNAIAVAASSAAVGFIALAFVSHPVLAAVLPMATIVAASAPFGAVYKVASDTDVGAGVGLGVVLAVGNLASLVFPALAGSIREATGGYEGAFLLLAGVNLVCVGAALALKRV